MATAFRDWPWPLQALFYVGLTIVLVLAGFYVPGSPLTTVRTELESAQAEIKPLEADVAKSPRVQAAPRGIANRDGCLAEAAGDVANDRSRGQGNGSVHSDGPARRDHLWRGHPIPDGEARSQQKPYYFEMPFAIEADGPYYSVLDFFSRMGRLSRIINVGDLKLTALTTTGARVPYGCGNDG